MSRQPPRRTPDSCPVCGADLAPGAAACPSCGADEAAGWSEETGTEGLDLPDDTFDYDDFVRREFGGGRRWRRRDWLWAVVAILLVALMLCWAVRR